MARPTATLFRRSAGAAALLGLVSACASPEGAALPLDPSRADPAALRVFVALPEGQAPLPGYPRMDLALAVAGGLARAAEVPLLPVRDARTPAGAAAYAASPEGEEAARAIGAALEDARGEGLSGSLGVEIAVETCRTGPATRGAVRVWTAGPDDGAARPLAMPTPPGPEALAHLDAKPPCP